MRDRTLRTLLFGAVAVGTIAGAGAIAQAPSHIEIVYAQIAEVGLTDPTRIVGRPVTIRIELAASPVCDMTSTGLAYGILVDADKNVRTGFRHDATGGLGIDARISATCDPTTGTFTSAVGDVTASTQPDGTGVVEIMTTADNLPSVDFNWVAYAAEGGQFFRLPGGEDHATWAVFEVTLR